MLISANLAKGFTLVELLITIAIIVVLATVVLGGLNDARVSGINAKIQGEMDAITKRASLEETNLRSFNTVCGSNGATQSPAVVKIITSIERLSAGPVVCNSGTTKYAVSAPLHQNHWCVDNTGAHKEIPNALAVDELVCP